MAKKTFKKELLKVGVLRHPKAPNQIIKVDRTFLQKLVDNFSKSPFAPVIRGHNEAEAERDTSLIVSKNTKNLRLEGDSLYGDIEMDEEELDKYNDVSVGMKLDAIDKQTGQSIGPLLRHVAMTMRPYVGNLKPFVQLSNIDEGILTINLSDISMNEEEKVEEVVEETPETATAEVVEEVKTEDQPTDTETIEEEAKEEVATETVEAEEVKTEAPAEPEVKEEKVELSETEQLKAEILKLNEEKAIALKEKNSLEADVKFSELLREGKILPVQKDAFKALYSAPEVMVEFSDSDEKVGIREAFDKFLKSMPTIVNLSEDGTTEDEEAAEARPFYSEYKESKPEMSDEEYDKYYMEHQQLIVEEMEARS